MKNWRFGVIDPFEYEAIAARGLARVRLSDKSPGILTKPLPVIVSMAGVDRVYVMPKIGDRVCVLLDDNCEDGVIIGSLYTDANNPPANNSNVHRVEFEDGTSVTYDKRDQKLTIDCQGVVQINGSQIFLN